jgi:hypothetical protein
MITMGSISPCDKGHGLLAKIHSVPELRSKFNGRALNQVRKLRPLKFEPVRDPLCIKALDHQPLAIVRLIEHFKHRGPRSIPLKE